MTQKEKQLERVEDWIPHDTMAEIFKKANKNKSSSPSGLHYTIWKAATESTAFCKYMSIMMSLSFKYGFANKRWQRAINLVLEKAAGVRHMHLLRIIGLVEAD